jgi:gamma-glutamyl-gamma-aminobutyrate hydrolase PuuD
MANVSIASNGDRYYQYLLSRVGALVPRSSDNIDLMLFTGGEDVTPDLYGGIDNGVSEYNRLRDEFETKLFLDCIKRGIKMVGICRGIQFLNVMAGGKMYQNIVGHTGVLHPVRLVDQTLCKVICTHHQLIIPPESAYIIAESDPKLAGRWTIGPDCKETTSPEVEIEGAIFPNINAFGVQFHPEFSVAPKESADLFVKLATDFLANDVQTFINIYGRKIHGQRRIEISA